MKQLLQSISIFCLFISTLVFAHPEGHEKPQTIYKEQAITTASYQLKLLVEKGELDKSWEAIKASDAVFERRDSRMNWIVTFNNLDSADKNKTTLIVNLTSTGYLISTSVSGL